MLEHDFGFDARSADMIVGTSAGSITGALLRMGVSAEDLAAWTVRAPLSGEGEVMRQIAEIPVPDRSDPEEARQQLATLTVVHMDGRRIDRLALRLLEGDVTGEEPA